MPPGWASFASCCDAGWHEGVIWGQREQKTHAWEPATQWLFLLVSFEVPSRSVEATLVLKQIDSWHGVRALWKKAVNLLWTMVRKEGGMFFPQGGLLERIPSTMKSGCTWKQRHEGNALACPPYLCGKSRGLGEDSWLFHRTKDNIHKA